MPFTNILKSSLIIVFGFAIGYGTVKTLTQPNTSNRQLASVTYSKLGSEQFAKSLFDVKIRNEKIAILQSDESIIKVTVEAFSSFPSGLVYNWNLSENVTIIEGQQSGLLEDFAANQKKEYTLKVKGYSKEVKNFISFTIKGELDQNKIQRDVLASSRPEDSFEFIVQEREKVRAQQDEKIIKKLGKGESKSLIDLNKVSF
jgi:hypothetical protein